MKKGKIIVIEGSDGVGKATQAKLLVNRLKKENIPVATFDFPQYKNHIGSLIASCLRGEHGDYLTLDPYISALLFGADRFETKSKIDKALAEGKIVVCDRYTSASQIHQGGKIKNSKKQREFVVWQTRLEHEVFGLPRPSRVIYLDLPVSISLRLMKGRKDKKASKKGKQDVAEKSLSYLENTLRAAKNIAKYEKNWKVIRCFDTNGILSRQEIHELVYKSIRDVL